MCNSNFGYNIAPIAGSALGRKHTEETKEKISIAAMGNKRNLGRKLSEEHKQNISKNNKGKTISKETREKISKSHIGMKHSKETKNVRVFYGI